MNCKNAQKLKIERWLSGEIQGEAYIEFSEHLDHCEACQAYRVELEREKQDFLLKHSFASFTKNNPEFLNKQKTREWSWKHWAVPVAASIVVALFLLPTRVEIEKQNTPDIIYKGKENLSLVVRRGADIFPAGDKYHFQGGDEVQFMVPKSYLKYRYQMMLSLDSLGVLSQYPPDFERLSDIMDSSSSSYPFPQTMILDDAPGFEIAFLLFSDSAISLDTWVSGIMDVFNNNKDPQVIQEKVKSLVDEEHLKLLTVALDK